MDLEVEDFTKKFTDEKLTGIVKIKRNFFQANSDLLEIKNKVEQEPFAIGKFLGSGKPFHPSLALLDWIGERSDNYVTVDKKAAWLFMCGRDVFGNSIIKKTVDKGPVIVKNQLGEVIGFGDMVGRKVAVKNVLDRGDFIRREKR